MNIFIPSAMLTHFVENWEDLEDETLLQIVGERIESAYFYFMWLMAVRQTGCRLVIVQYADQSLKEVYPHHQIGDLFILSCMHPERAIAEAMDLETEGDDGIGFVLPFSPEIEGHIYDIAKQFDLETEEDTEILMTAMLMIQAAHETYLEELDENMFYVATRGTEEGIDALLADEHGDWAVKMMGIIDENGTSAMNKIYAEKPKDAKKDVPVFFQYDIDEEEAVIEDMPRPTSRTVN